jgi:hypothetical protein
MPHINLQSAAATSHIRPKLVIAFYLSRHSLRYNEEQHFQLGHETNLLPFPNTKQLSLVYFSSWQRPEHHGANRAPYPISMPISGPFSVTKVEANYSLRPRDKIPTASSLATVLEYGFITSFMIEG